MQQEQALGIARMLVKAGVPVFVAHPDPRSASGWALPFGWESTEADPAAVEAWRPGMALCAVTGRTFDLVDVDTYAGGDERTIPMPKAYLLAETASGGRHYFVKTLGVGSLDGKVAPGIDIKSGTAEGTGRGFAFIAPTVRRSKVDGQPREYRWVVGAEGPVLPTPDQLAADGSGALLAARVLEIRRTAVSSTPRTVPESVARREWDSAVQGLRTSIEHWQRYGWGGEAHSSILASTTHLARLSTERAEEAFFWAFRAAGAEPDGNDLSKLASALEKAVPDIVVPDAQLSSAEAFFLGGEAPPTPFGMGPSLPDVFGGATGLTTMTPGSPTSSTGEGRRRFQPMSRAEAASIQAPEALVDGLLLSNTKARLSGPSGTGKTWVVLDLAAHVAAGMPWQGHAVTKTRVLYVAGEGAPSFDSRIKAWEEKHGRQAEVDIVPEAVQIASEDWAEFASEIKEQNYGLIIFDTQGSMTVGLEENSNKDANIVLSQLDLLRRLTGACLLLVHHTGHEEKDRPRGASAMYGGMDTELMLAGSVRDLKLKAIKQKYIELGKAQSMRTEASAGGLVLVPPSGPQAGASGFFTEVQATEHQVRVQALVSKLGEYYTAGGTAKPSVRSLVQVLRKELNVKGRTEVLFEAAQRYVKDLGMPVDIEDDAVS